jgi:ABC-type multidrug transport system ATPase subunit
MMIEIANVTFCYEPGSAVLNDIKAEISPGLTLLLGPNGCGKSTLMKLLAGVEKPDSGQIRIDGYDLWQEEKAARQNLAYMPEHPDLSPYATIGEIIQLVCRLRGLPLENGLRALDAVSLSGWNRATVRQLSLGQRMRALLAACFIGDPHCLLLDEPLAGMDLCMQQAILEWITSRIAGGATIVLISHELTPFVTLLSRALTIRDGQLAMLEELPEETAERTAWLEGLCRGTITLSF